MQTTSQQIRALQKKMGWSAQHVNAHLMIWLDFYSSHQSVVHYFRELAETESEYKGVTGEK